MSEMLDYNNVNENTHENAYDNDYYSSDSDINNYSKYTLGLCSLHNSRIHGGNSSENAKICGRFLFMREISLHNPYLVSINRQRTQMINNIIRGNGGYNAITHPTIRNYNRIMFDKLVLEPQIVEKIWGPGEYCSAIVKTHYLRLIQRKWKRIYAHRKKTIALRKCPKAIMYRNVNGKWPNNCNKWI